MKSNKMKRKALFILMTFILGLTWTAKAQVETRAVADLTINSASEWSTFCTNVNNGTNYAGQTVTLGADITVTTVCGTGTDETGAKAFAGHFNGAGHKITLNLTPTAYYCAPFSCINVATIENLKVDGSHH